jgi:hypothetical protein
MGKTKQPECGHNDEWPFDTETLESEEVRTAVGRFFELADDITITSAQAMALVGRTGIGDGERVSLQRVAELLDRPNAAHTIACGMHSGFPACCIRYFVQTAYLQDAEFMEHMFAIEAAGTPGYIPCPECLRAKRFVEVRGCDCRARLEAVIVRAAEQLRASKKR